ncbi:MAG: citramalate synthase [Planctomycetota bacterium]|jgi:2-isopropylmalate synthase
MAAKKVEIYDTTLRDGTQGEGVSISVAGKLDIARELDKFGIQYIEGGWPGSNPKDMEFFEQAKKLKLKTARIAAFGSTRHAKNKPSEDPNLRKLVESRAPVLTIFGKSWDLHVTDALRVSLDANLKMISSSISYLKKKCETTFFDAEHFYDGYKNNPEYALKALEAAADAGAECLILCDTNGGCLPSEIRDITSMVVDKFKGIDVGIHTHNDGNMAVANAVVGVEAGAVHVQGTTNGIGERCGNCDLTSVLPILELKMNRKCVGKKSLKSLTEVSRFVYEVANVPILDRQPFVGKSAFAHKGGIHVSAIARNEKTYEHVRPEDVGNERRILISELSGKSNLLARSKSDLSKNPEAMKKILSKIMELEKEGYVFESADASFDLLVKRTLGTIKPSFELKGFRVISEAREDETRISEATVRLDVAGEKMHTAAEGTEGPVDALNSALRKALEPHYPVLEELRLVDYKVVIVDASRASQAHVRVTIESADHHDVWTTVGASANIIEASYLALVDAIEYKLQKTGKAVKKKKIKTKK